jgi:hypothetical protein
MDTTENKKENEMEKKTLEIGKDYGFAFALPEGGKMVYNGGHSWTAIMGDKMKTIDNEATTAKALEYINRPTIKMGRM